MKPQDRARYEALGIRFINEPLDVVAAVNDRLREWKDYHEHRAYSTPGKAYTVAAKVADEIYESRKPMLQMNTPDPEINLRVPDELIGILYQQHLGAVAQGVLSHPRMLDCNPLLSKYGHDPYKNPDLSRIDFDIILHPERNPLFSKHSRRESIE